MLLECFGGGKAAGKARRGLDAELKSQGDALLDTVVLQVNAKHKASVHGPRRVVQATLTATLTWGLFGLVAGGLKSLAIWSILGAICGGLWAYYTEHLLRKDELARIGARLPASSSAPSPPRWPPLTAGRAGYWSPLDSQLDTLAGWDVLTPGAVGPGGSSRRARASAERGRVQGPGRAEADPHPRTITVAWNSPP